MTICDSVVEAEKRLTLKILAFSEAYIFVLEASQQSLKNLGALLAALERGEQLQVDPKTIHGSFLRLSEYLQEHGIGTDEYFRSILFVDLISSTEIFFAELIKAVISEYPEKIGRIQFELKDILRAASPTELVAQAADVYINKLMYEKPEDYLERLCTTLSIESNQLNEFWPSYIEAKARRDLGVHNSWKCNKTYIRKVKAFLGENVDAKEGQIMSPKDKDYCSDVGKNIMGICKTMSQLVREKYS